MWNRGAGSAVGGVGPVGNAQPHRWHSRRFRQRGIRNLQILRNPQGSESLFSAITLIVSGCRFLGFVVFWAFSQERNTEKSNHHFVIWSEA